jgi:multidrug transporter EmrE-like cation transporter
MRWLKKLLTAVLVYIAVYLPFVVLMQSLTGYDFTGAYAAVTGVGAVELIVGGIIKVAEAKRKKDGDDGSEESAEWHPTEDVP